MNYKEELANLANLSHGRNNHLMAVVSAGRLAGRTDAQMRDEIVAASGTPPLTAAIQREPHSLRQTRRE